MDSRSIVCQPQKPLLWRDRRTSNGQPKKILWKKRIRSNSKWKQQPRKKSYKINNIGIICLYICCDSWWLSLQTSTYDPARQQAFKKRPSSLYNVMYIVQTIRCACLFFCSFTECAALSHTEEANEKKDNNTNPHPSMYTVYRCYCCSVDTFQCLSSLLAFYFGIEFYPDLHIPLSLSLYIFPSLSFSLSFYVHISYTKIREKCYCFAHID